MLGCGACAAGVVWGRELQLCRSFIPPSRLGRLVLLACLRYLVPIVAGLAAQQTNKKFVLFPCRSYLAPIVADLAAQQPPITRAQGTYAIVICPTRELCLQVADVLTMLVRRFVWLVS